MHHIQSILLSSSPQGLLLRHGRRCLFKSPPGVVISRHFHASYATTKMYNCFPALFARGGTSNGLIIKRSDLPPQDLWHKVLPAAMGSPDPYGRQLNGMGTSMTCFVEGTRGCVEALQKPSRRLEVGLPVTDDLALVLGGGISSTSKICILSPSEKLDADVDFTFVQVGVRDGALDLAGNCGNMLSAVGPAA